MKTLKKLFLDGLAEIYDAEKRLAWSMPQMVASATCVHLQDAMAANLQETQEHVSRLEGIFDSLGEKVRRKTNETTIALLDESLEIMSSFEGFPVINAALIALVQKIEHYEIAFYGCLRDWAAVLGEKEVADILQEILDEDKATNQSLTELARSRSNLEALSEEPAKGKDPPGLSVTSWPAVAGVDLEMEGDLIRFESEAPTHEIFRDNGMDSNGSEVRPDVMIALQSAADSQAKLWRTTDRKTSYERQHRFVD